MAVPKRRQSKARRDKRRAQWMKMAPPPASRCPHCNELRMPHHACPSCGKYGNDKEARVVIAVKSESSAS